ncbi:hypothetical protein FQN57_006807 [Myotisia sp. PD_48]|nr:hypothetical protein FQN57_006807 [Myotisia sp. PD_48]
MACDILPRTTPRPPPFPSPINTDTASSHTHGSINCSLLRPIPPDSSVMDDYRKGYHQPQSYQHQRSSIPLTGTAGIMPHHYQSDEDQQQYTYGRTNQYAIPQHSFPQNYPHSQILASCGHNPPDASVLAPPYSSPHTLFAQPSHHASILASPPSSSALSYQCHPHVLSQPRFPAPHRYYPLHEPCWEIEIEAQESCNEHTALSEPIHPPLEGFPDVREFDLLMKSYVEDLSVKKQDKALIHSKRARNIKIVLADPKDTAIESAQFRFWVKKMFKLEPCDNRTPLARRMICHEGKPVAIREKLFKILTRAHQQCQHGGRDKTSAQARNATTFSIRYAFAYDHASYTKLVTHRPSYNSIEPLPPCAYASISLNRRYLELLSKALSGSKRERPRLQHVRRIRFELD